MNTVGHLPTIEDSWIVTESVRKGIDVAVQVESATA